MSRSRVFRGRPAETGRLACASPPRPFSMKIMAEIWKHALQFEAARNISPDNEVVYRNLERRMRLMQGLRLDPNRSSIWGNLGTVERHSPCREQDAREAFRKTIELAQKTLEVMPSD